MASGGWPAQLALAWLLAQGEEIPGTRRRKYLDENIAAVQIELTAAELAELDRLAPPGAAAGERYAPDGMQTVNV